MLCQSLLVIRRQVPFLRVSRVDRLALDGRPSCAVELKPDKTLEDVTEQALDYRS